MPRGKTEDVFQAREGLSGGIIDKIASFFEGRGAFLFLVPALVLIGIFVIFPVVWDVYISMTNASLVGPSARHYSFINKGLRYSELL